MHLLYVVFCQDPGAIIHDGAAMVYDQRRRRVRRRIMQRRGRGRGSETSERQRRMVCRHDNVQAEQDNEMNDQKENGHNYDVDQTRKPTLRNANGAVGGE